MSSENPTSSTTSPPTRSKSRIMRMLTTKRPKDSEGGHPSSSRRPPVVNSAFSKEQREAALRARGLLPPLSLSQQERELDNTIPVVRPAETIQEDGEAKVSAADLIKQQWESKNRQRMEEFKFGSENSSPSGESKESNTDDESRSESSLPQEPIQKSAKARRRQGLHQASLSQPMLMEAEALKELEHRRSLSVQTKGLPSVPEDAPKETTSVTPVLDLPIEFQRYLDEPPPPSLLKTQPQRSSHENKASITSVHTEDTATGRRSPARRPHKDDKPLPTSHRTADTIVAPSSAISPTETLVSASHERSDSPPRAESGSSSIHTPSLDGSSSTMKSSESLTNAKLVARRLLGNPVENGVPVIDESPRKGRDAHETNSVENASDKDAIRSASRHGHDDTEDSDFAGDDDDGDSPPPVPSKGRRRGLTDPPPPKHITLADTADQVLATGDGPAPTRRKTINPFKRNQQKEDGTGGKISLRSVVGTVLRPRGERNGAAGRMTSPTRPQDSSVSPPHSPKRAPAQPLREALNPQFYTAGDIQEQANTIKDDEERRMAELAFMF